MLSTNRRVFLFKLASTLAFQLPLLLTSFTAVEIRRHKQGIVQRATNDEPEIRGATCPMQLVVVVVVVEISKHASNRREILHSSVKEEQTIFI